MTDDADVRGLREKYETMLALRVVHERARADPSFVEPDPRRVMAALAARFPGALREIDELPMETIRARIGELAAAESGDAVAPWMIAQTSFHRLARGALAAKRWLGKRRATSSAVDGAFARAIADGDLPEEALAWAGALAALARPPRGRLMDLVFSRIASDLAMDDARVRELVFGPPRRRRR